MGQTTPIRRTALVVEDDADQRFLVATLIEETGLEVIECASAEAALAVLERTGDRIALVFSDIRLSGRLDGVDLAQVVKRRFPAIRMIVTSGVAPDRAADLPRDARFMAKPWLAIELLMEAERSLAQHRGA
jgi:DNA-binding NtrC family response regulator